ncbi:hypothetical protein LCGC14_2887380, partial [marine sediment metagenome]
MGQIRRGLGKGRKESVFGEVGPPKTIQRFDVNIVAPKVQRVKIRDPV